MTTEIPSKLSGLPGKSSSEQPPNSHRNSVTSPSFLVKWPKPPVCERLIRWVLRLELEIKLQSRLTHRQSTPACSSGEGMRCRVHT